MPTVSEGRTAESRIHFHGFSVDWTRSLVTKQRTDADSGGTPSVRLKDGFGQRTLKNIRKWMAADGCRSSFARLKDESERRTEADDQQKRTKSVRRALVEVLVTEF